MPQHGTTTDQAPPRRPKTPAPDHGLPGSRNVRPKRENKLHRNVKTSWGERQDSNPRPPGPQHRACYNGRPDDGCLRWSATASRPQSPHLSAPRITHPLPPRSQNRTPWQLAGSSRGCSSSSGTGFRHQRPLNFALFGVPSWSPRSPPRGGFDRIRTVGWGIRNGPGLRRWAGILVVWAGIAGISSLATLVLTGCGRSGWPGSWPRPGTPLSWMCGTGRRARTS